MANIIEGEEYLTVEEAAEFVGYSRAWFTKRIVPDHNLQAYQKGLHRPILYKKGDLEPLVKLRPVESDGAKPEQ